MIKVKNLNTQRGNNSKYIYRASDRLECIILHTKASRLTQAKIGGMCNE